MNKHTIEDFEFYDNVDFSIIEETAIEAGERLTDEPFKNLIVGLQPKDGTAYRIMITPSIVDRFGFVGQEPMPPGLGGSPEFRMVSILFGATYPWYGDVIHQDYVKEHWDVRQHTSNVMAAFLSLVAYYLHN